MVRRQYAFADSIHTTICPYTSRHQPRSAPTGLLLHPRPYTPHAAHHVRTPARGLRDAQELRPGLEGAVQEESVRCQYSSALSKCPDQTLRLVFLLPVDGRLAEREVRGDPT